MKWLVQVAGLVAVLVMASLPVHAQAIASVFSIVSPPDGEAVPVGSQPPQIAIDAAGRIMVAYKFKGADGKILPYSALRIGDTWQHAAIPIPQLSAYPSSLTLRGLVGGASGQGFHLVGTHYGTIFYWHWQNGVWSAPETVPPRTSTGGLSAAGIALKPTGEPIVVWSHTRFEYMQKVNGQWQTAKLLPEIAQRSIPPIYANPSGAIHLLGIKRYNPLVTSLPASADPLVDSNWVSTPTSDPKSWTSVLGSGAVELELALDWPHQLVFAAWESKKHLYVGWAPIGATSEGQWRTADIPLPERVGHIDHCLVSNGRGGVGLLVCAYDPSEPVLTFHWLSGAGPGPQIPILRPGTDTEASVFKSVPMGHTNMCIDPQGTAHIAMVATKRGEQPANRKRLYYATVTGGGTATSGPEVTGGGTTQMDREGPAPDFVATILKPNPNGQDRLTFAWQHSTVEPQIEIANQGAEFYGDLWFEANIDGAVMRVRVPDESNHRQPLFKRGEKRKFYLPDVVYESAYQQGVQPPNLSFDSKKRPTNTRVYTGLGRKQMLVVVDPDNAIEEADEQNNIARAEYVIADGRNQLDIEKGPGNQRTAGLNDLAIMMPPRLLSNTQLLRAGYVQRPTQLNVVVGNPRFAGFFLNAETVVYLDGAEIGRETIAFLDRQPNLVSAALGTVIIYDKQPPKPDMSAVELRFPVHLEQVPEGNHTIVVKVDPDDKFADLTPGNNQAAINFKVRPPGGTLKVHVVDLSAPHPPVGKALVVFEDLWAGWADEQGFVEIPDVPGQDYGGTSLQAERLDQEPKFFPGYADPFTVAQNQICNVTIRLERPLTVVGTVTNQQTGLPVNDDYVGVGIRDDDLFLGGTSNGANYRILDVPPGSHKFVAGAYGYHTTTVQRDVRRASPNSDECRIDLQLLDGERSTVTGQVLEQTGANTTPRPLPGAFVWLAGAPRGSQTDANGNYTLTRVAAGRPYTAFAEAENHAIRSVDSPTLQAGQTHALDPIVLPKITQKFKSIDFDSTTWGICEETPGELGMPEFKVETKFGAFTGSVGILYHTTAGQANCEVDNVLIQFQGGDFIQGGVSSSVGLESLTGVSLDVLKVGPMDTLLSGLGKAFSVVSGINKFDEWLSGDVDPSQMHRNNEVTGTYTTHTGAEYKQDPLIDIPTSTDVPVGMGFHGGGSTVVRVDFIEFTDGVNPTRKIRAEWYSPGLAAFNVGKQFQLDTLQVKLYVAVLNQRLQTGVLGNTSRNLITWKPNENNWLRMEGCQYEVFND